MPVAACKSGVGKDAPKESSYMLLTTFEPAASRILESGPSDTNICPMHYLLDVFLLLPMILIVLPKLLFLPCILNRELKVELNRELKRELKVELKVELKRMLH